MDVNGMMDFCEELLRESVQNATGHLKVTYEGNKIDFSNFERITMRDAI
jgi:lysyl-tRNA synthetase class II